MLFQGVPYILGFLHLSEPDPGTEPRKNGPSISDLWKNQAPNVESVLNKKNTQFFVD